jgi:hypothetical protein
MLRAVLIATIIFWTTSVCAQGLPNLPPPSGFVESSTLVPALKEQALLGHPAGTRLLGVYLLPDELSAIMHGAEERMSIFCRAYVIHESATEDDAKAFFRALVTNAKKDGSRPFSLDDPEKKRIIQGYVDATKQKRGQSVGLTGATILGSIVDTDAAYGQLMVVAGKAQTARGEIAIPMTSALAWVRHGNQILEMSDVAQFTGQDSIDLAKGVVTNWVKALPSLDPAHAAPPSKGDSWGDDVGYSASAYYECVSSIAADMALASDEPAETIATSAKASCNDERSRLVKLLLDGVAMGHLTVLGEEKLKDEADKQAFGRAVAAGIAARAKKQASRPDPERQNALTKDMQDKGLAFIKCATDNVDVMALASNEPAEAITKSAIAACRSKAQDFVEADARTVGRVASPAGVTQVERIVSNGLISRVLAARAATGR